MNDLQSHRGARRLIAAEGYLELGMPARAHQELEAVANVQVLRKYVEYLRGEAFRAEGDYVKAIECLEFAAKRIPAPFNLGVWKSLGICYRAQGADELAEAAESMAERSISITLLIQPPASDRPSR